MENLEVVINNMRDINRIPSILVTLGKIWHEEPDLRLGQLICILANKLGYDEPFFMEDDELLNTMKEWLNNYKK